MRRDTVKEEWIPKTELGRKVMNGEITDILDILKKGYVIRESEIVDFLVPDITEEVMLIGGHTGKGGGIKRTGVKVTNRMHKSGRKRSLHIMVVVGNKNGLIGLGYARGNDAKGTIEKAIKKAKTNLMYIKRGCGSWECNCSGIHSIPFKMTTKFKGMEIAFYPAPKGTGLAVASEVRKIMHLAGIKDIWSKSRGSTKARVKFISSVFDAFKNANSMKINDTIVKNTGLKEGAVNVSSN